METLDRHHPAQVSQGSEFPSAVFCKHYEVYPEVQAISWEMPVDKALDWLSQTRSVNIRFYYDYRRNNARIAMPSLPEDLWEKMKSEIPGFYTAFTQARQAMTALQTDTQRTIGQSGVPTAPGEVRNSA